MHDEKEVTVLDRSSRWLLILVIAGLLFFALLKVLSIWAEGLWFASEGYGNVFVQILVWRLGLFIVGFAWFFVLVYVPYRLARWVAEKVPMPLRAKLFDDMDKVLVDVALNRWALGVCLTLAFVAGLIASNRWFQLLHFLYATPFDMTDPIFGKDVSFYVFVLPLLRFWVTFTLVGLVFGIAAIVLRLRYEELLRFEETGMEAPVFVARPLLAIAATFLFVLAIAQFLGRYSILFSKRGVVFGAGFSDIYGTLSAFWLLMAVSITGVLWCLYLMRTGNLKPIRKIGLIIVSAWLFGRILLPAGIQAFVVVPNELERERRFLDYNIKATRFAYNLEKVQVHSHPAHPIPTIDEIRSHESVLENVRLWDIEQLLDILAQVQAIQLYYNFSSVDYDRYIINGKLRQVAIATRELFLQPEQRTWVNEHLRYTHGYNVVVVPVTEFTKEGMPKFLVKDIRPPTADGSPLRIRRPEIYFGEFTLPEERFRRQPFVRPQQTPQQTSQPPAPPTAAQRPPEEQPPAGAPASAPRRDQQAQQPTRQQPAPVADYVLVRTKEPEFDYSVGQGAEQMVKETTYQEDAGVPIGSWWRRVLFAARFMDLNLLLTTAITPESRLLMYRQVLKRVNALAPFLITDADPYPVITDDGRIVWLVDTYTFTGTFPYSTPNPLEPRMNYLRNSVKVTVDAYTGRMTFYAIDELDPILRTYRKAFPTLFQSFDTMPSDIKSHIRYPRALFLSQALLYSYYHMTTPDQFYNKVDVWERAKEIFWMKETFDNKVLPMLPYYIVMRSPDDNRDRFLLLLPFTPLGKRVMIAWMAAHCDHDRYGELFLYHFPRGSPPLGPEQVEARISTDAKIRPQLTLWDQQGSRVIRGNLLVVPIGKSLLYIEPLYLLPEQTRLPELKRVIVADNSRVVMGEDLWDAIWQLFKMPLRDRHQPQRTTLSPDRQPKAPQALSVEIMGIARLLKEADAARRKGDWATFGKAFDQAFNRALRLEQKFGSD